MSNTREARRQEAERIRLGAKVYGYVGIGVSAIVGMAGVAPGIAAGVFFLETQGLMDDHADSIDSADTNKEEDGPNTKPKPKPKPKPSQLEIDHRRGWIDLGEGRRGVIDSRPVFGSSARNVC